MQLREAVALVPTDSPQLRRPGRVGLALLRGGHVWSPAWGRASASRRASGVSPSRSLRRAPGFPSAEIAPGVGVERVCFESRA